MNEAFVSVPTRIKGRFRMAEAGSRARFAGMAGGQTTGLLRDALVGQDGLARFLIEMDRKLDAILTLLQRETIIEEFPHEAIILELSGAGLALESRMNLNKGDCMELLLLPDDYQQRPISVMAEVPGERPEKTTADSAPTVYAVRYTSLGEEDRELIIQFAFQEERKLTRKRKGEAHSA